MNNEKLQSAVELREGQVEKDASSEKSAEVIEAEILQTSEKEAGDFINIGEAEMLRAEQIASAEGLEIDGSDKIELQALSREAEMARREFADEIGNSKNAKQENKSTQENIKIKNICSGCGREGREGHNFCEECGKKMESLKTCSGCGKENKMGNNFCEDCGNKFEKNESRDWGTKDADKQSIEAQSEINIIKPSNLLKERKIINIEGLSEKELEDQKRTVEDTILRNNAFVVHVITEHEKARHNDNSNVSSETTYEDDIDIFLSLEPAISASSVTPGKKATLWPGASGFLLGGGYIGEASTSDSGTRPHGIKSRGGENSSIEKIDKVVGRNDRSSEQDYERFGYNMYNEFVVNDSEVAGFFQHAEQDEDGRFWALALSLKDLSIGAERDKFYKEALNKNVSNYKKRFAVASERGIPLYIMTPNRLVYECLAVNDDGTVEVGKQLTPEEVAKGRAGLPADKRKEIGERLLNRKIFRDEKIQKEAEEIIENL